MSQFDTSFPGEAGQTPQRTSRMAITSLVSALIFCCPLTTILAVLLGAISFVRIGGNPILKGRGLAVAAILLGLIFTGGQYFGGKKVYTLMYEPILKLPSEALSAGQSGDLAGFKASFYGTGAAASDDEAQAFLDAVEQTHGAFTSAMITGQQSGGSFGQTEAVFKYDATFAQGSVPIEASIIFADEATGEFVMKLGSLTIKGADGDLTYPSTSAAP